MIKSIEVLIRQRGFKENPWGINTAAVNHLVAWAILTNHPQPYHWMACGRNSIKDGPTGKPGWDFPIRDATRQLFHPPGWVRMALKKHDKIPSYLPFKGHGDALVVARRLDGIIGLRDGWNGLLVRLFTFYYDIQADIRLIRLFMKTYAWAVTLTNRNYLYPDLFDIRLLRLFTKIIPFYVGTRRTLSRFQYNMENL